MEGTALARGVLIELAERRCMTLATSHLGALNSLPGEQPGIVSAGLAFDPERLQPLYRLVKGRPGRSYALAMAQRVGFPRKVLERARASLSPDELDTARLLAELEGKEAELEARLAELSRREQELEARAAAQERAAADLDERTREQEREAHERAREFLLEARRKLNEALQADRRAAREARRELEASLRAHSEALRESESAAPTPPGTPFEPGDEVWITTLERKGRVVERRGGEVVVEMGAVKLQLPAGVLTRKPGGEAPAERVALHSTPEVDARHEIDLRGMVSEEARMELRSTPRCCRGCTSCG